MSSKRLRVIIPVAVLVLLAIGYILHWDFGTLSAFGWSTVSVLCPLGALTTALAEQAMIPRVAISFALVLILMTLFGKAFCAWICPVPVVRKLQDVFKRKGGNRTELSIPSGSILVHKYSDMKFNDQSDAKKSVGCPASTASKTGKEVITDCPAFATGQTDTKTPVGCSASADDQTRQETAPTAIDPAASSPRPLNTGGPESRKSDGCSPRAKKRGAVLDSRHIILGGSVFTALVFGFPVFCLICPIGLTFASVFLLINLFTAGDLTWAVAIVPLLLLVEVVFFRKWCSRICPLSAFMSLTGKIGRFFRPKIDNSRCMETAQDRPCGICGAACPESVDPRHPSTSVSSISECTRCRICVDSCPGKAIRIPVWSAGNERDDEMPQETMRLSETENEHEG